MSKAVQASVLPTNKVMTFAFTNVIVTNALMAVGEGLIAQNLPFFADERIYAMLGVIIAGVVSWFIKDKPNVPVA